MQYQGQPRSQAQCRAGNFFPQSGNEAMPILIRYQVDVVHVLLLCMQQLYNVIVIQMAPCSIREYDSTSLYRDSTSIYRDSTSLSTSLYIGTVPLYSYIMFFMGKMVLSLQDRWHRQQLVYIHNQLLNNAGNTYRMHSTGCLCSELLHCMQASTYILLPPQQVLLSLQRVATLHMRMQASTYCCLRSKYCCLCSQRVAPGI